MQQGLLQRIAQPFAPGSAQLASDMPDQSHLHALVLEQSRQCMVDGQEDPLAAFTKPAAPPSWETFGNDSGYGADAFNNRPEAEDYFGDDPLAAYGKAEDGAAPAPVLSYAQGPICLQGEGCCMQVHSVLASCASPASAVED